MKNRRKRKNNKNHVMSIRVLLASTPQFLRKDEHIYPEELLITGQDPNRVVHLRAVHNFSTEQMGVDVNSENIVMERGFCIHKACRCCPAITINCKSMIDWEGAVIQRDGNIHPEQRIIEIQPPVDITTTVYNNVIKCSTFRKLKILTKDETIRLVSTIIAMTLPYYTRPKDVEKDKALGKSLTKARVEWIGERRWAAEYDLFLLENFAEGLPWGSVFDVTSNPKKFTQ